MCNAATFTKADDGWRMAIVHEGQPTLYPIVGWGFRIGDPDEDNVSPLIADPSLGGVTDTWALMCGKDNVFGPFGPAWSVEDIHRFCKEQSDVLSAAQA